ncbi:dihydrodipicolinate synthase family protein [Nonomuraea sp. NEAU-A123]|uniref:dihydrodipicolinate synthase family protein n=1 Tax=Nonomuraea sp. NEAU-A123 TaxID=2839649 RepID=UPI001BE408AE|nr:dihydrodipicolinate synthase family protein [Nonomuraea sp. NEAU-A123]MBT2233850.1 dihydrodipicolinate synthase family protein [Nonomuraea sp. NEAU-A123]
MQSFLTRKSLSGTWGTVLLPLRSDDSIDFARLADELDRLAAVGLDGVYAHGTAGEFHALSDQEYQQVNELLAERCAGLPFQIGASHMSATTCLRRVELARELRPGAIQVILPDWAPPSRAEVVTFLERVAEVADPVPLVLYNPPHAKTRLTPADFGMLAARVPALVGVKVAGGDAGWYREMLNEAADLPLFVAGHTLATGMELGAAGSYSNIAAFSPAGAMAWQHLMRTAPAAARDVERRIGRFFAEHVRPLASGGYANPALDKFLAHVGGWADIGTRVRWPYRSVAEQHAERLRPIARMALPELFPAP